MDTDETDPVILHGDTGIRSANDLAQHLKEALANNRRIVVDTSAVTAADLTTAQTLLAARKQAVAAGGDVVLRSPIGPPLVEVLRACGFLAVGQSEAGFWPTTNGAGCTR